ncbi:MAG: peptidase domain-containing ABC transporter, partial [Hyphomicrobiaceae bacterium]
AATARTNSATRIWSSLAIYLTGTIQQLVGIVVIVWGVFLVAEGTITVGGLIAASILSGRVLAPLGNIVMTLARAQHAISAMRGLTGFMKLERDQSGDIISGQTISSGAVEFRDVTFSYPGAMHPALQNRSFKIKPGQHIGFIGKIGSGKSTIGKLLAGFYAPGSGSILIDEVDLRRYEKANLRENVGFVSQEAELFSGTIRENIILGKPNATDEEINYAVRVAGVEAFVATHPLGLNRSTGERGRALSGGQRQAVALARMLLRRPRILFLDESSGAMDTATEAALIDNLVRWAGENHTLIICSHRVSFLGLADRLLLVDGGRLVAHGPRDTVMNALQADRVPATANNNLSDNTGPVEQNQAQTTGTHDGRIQRP